MKNRSNENSGKLQFLVVEDVPAHLLAPESLHGLSDPNERKLVTSRRDEFLNQAQSIDPESLLGLTALYCLKGGIFSPGMENTYPEVAELEFLQTIILSANSTDKRALDHAEVMDFWRELKRQFYVIAHEPVSDRSTKLETLAQSYGANYRNPYGHDFFDQMLNIICTTYDEKYIRDGSFRLTGQALLAIKNELRKRINEYIAAFAKICDEDPRSMMGDLPEFRTDEFTHKLGELSKEELRAILTNQLEDEAVKSLFILQEQWICEQEASGLPVRDVLSKLTLRGISSENRLSAMVQLNPIWSRPVMLVESGYALYSMYTLMSFPFSILLVLLGESSDAKTRIEKIRGQFVENEVKRMLVEGLPSAKIISSGNWLSSDGKQMETDLLVMLDRNLLIFEAKGALIPDRARQGKVDAVKHFLRRVWGKSTEQGQLLAARLQSDQPPLQILDTQGCVLLTIVPPQLMTISRFSVSIEQMGLFMNAPAMLKREGVLDADADPAPCVVLSELALLLGYLSSQEERLHYLTRRAEICRRFDFFGDELDLFTVYIQYGFSNIPNSTDQLLMLLGASYNLKEYLDKNDKVRIPTDSSLNNSPFFYQLLGKLKQRRSPAFLAVALLLMDFSLSEQFDFTRQMNEIFKRPQYDKDWPMISTTVECFNHKSVICGVYADRNATADELRGVASEILQTKCAEVEARNGFVFVRMSRSKSSYDALYYTMT